VGYQALYANTTGFSNIAIGKDALDSNTEGQHNSVMGVDALQASTTGNYNTAVGSGALFGATTANQNTAVGYEAGRSTTVSGDNTYIGWQAGRTRTGSGNTCVGQYSGRDGTTGSDNTLIGRNAGYGITTGSSNTVVGVFSGNQHGLDIRTSNNNIVLSDGAGFPRLHYIGSWRGQSDTASSWGYILDNINATNPFGLLVRTTGSDDNDGSEAAIEFQALGTNRFTVANTGNVSNTNNSYGAISDVKLKEQITDASSQWDDIKALTIRKFKMKQEVSAKGDSDALWKLGVIAQEVETAGMNGLVSESIDRDADLNDLGTTTKQVKYSILYMKAVKALQEAMERIETLEAKVTALENG
jgi:hypothetical protein